MDTDNPCFTRFMTLPAAAPNDLAVTAQCDLACRRPGCLAWITDRLWDY